MKEKSTDDAGVFLLMMGVIVLTVTSAFDFYERFTNPTYPLNCEKNAQVITASEMDAQQAITMFNGTNIHAYEKYFGDPNRIVGCAWS